MKIYNLYYFLLLRIIIKLLTKVNMYATLIIYLYTKNGGVKIWLNIRILFTEKSVKTSVPK